MSNCFPRGIDITAPGGIAKLMNFHRLTFGDAVMEADPDAAAAVADAQADADAAAEAAKPDEKLGEGGMRALQAERDARAAAEKRATDAEAKIQAAEDAKLSDIERAKKEAADAATETAQLRQDNARLAALAAYPVPKDYQDLVTGTDAASYEASAKKVSELVKAQGKKLDRIGDSGSKSGEDRGGAGTSVSAGRDLYASKHTKKS